jgi:hypothetical protein
MLYICNNGLQFKQQRQMLVEHQEGMARMSQVLSNVQTEMATMKHDMNQQSQTQVLASRRALDASLKDFREEISQSHSSKRAAESSQVVLRVH